MGIAGLGSPYWYEWEVGLLECLNMMQDNTINSVVLQSSDFESLDDVVVYYSDDSIVNIQVKHTDCDDHFTYSSLSSGEDPMLKKWAKEWLASKSKYNIREIRIVTNRKWGPAASGGKCSFKDFINNVFPLLRANYNYVSEKISQNAAIKWFKEQIDFLGDDASEFAKILFFVQEGDLSSVELKIRNNVASILGTDRKEAIKASTDSLLAKLEVWATSIRERQEISREDIYKALCATPVNLPRYELYPEKPIFPSRETFAQSFVSTLKTCNKKMYFLQGLPGSGKTNFVSYLAQLEDTIVDFRFYTYLPVNKEHPTFSDDAGFYNGDLLWGSILTQLKDGFERIGKLHELKFPLIYSYLSVTEKREKVLEYLPIYAKAIGHTCYVFIDGLDHAARSNDARNSFLWQLPSPDEIGEDVKIVLVGQPVNDRYPVQLLRNEKIEYISLPVLEEPDIIMLLSDTDIDVPGVDASSLAKSIISVVGNNALNVMFAIYEVKKMQSQYTFDLIIACLQERQLNSQIDRYYEWIVSSLERNILLLKIELIFSFASQKIPARYIADMCDVDLEDVVFVLNKLYPLIISDGDNYFTFHNDVRLFFKETIIRDSSYETLALSICRQITQVETLNRYKYDVLFGLAYELSDKQVLFDLFSTEYIMKSILYDISITKLIQQFQTVSQLVNDSGNLDNINKVSLAASTISQYINCVQYNEKEHLLYDRSLDEYKTESEKYILDCHKEIDVIVYDIYTLIKNSMFSRAEKLFAEYLVNTTLDDFLNSGKDDSDHSFCERSGFICRYFAPDILNQDVGIDGKNYAVFVKGWLKASSAFVDLTGIQQTFSFRSYIPEALNSYTEKVCSADVDIDSFNQLCDNYLSGPHKPIISLIELCVKGLFSGYDTSKLQDVILARKGEILTSEHFEFRERITCYIKLYFCVFSKLNSNDEMLQLYGDIMVKSHIKSNDRGRRPALAQFKLANKIAQIFYGHCQATVNNQIYAIYESVFFSQRYGSGSSDDCNWYRIRPFLLNVIFHYYKTKCDKQLIAEICDGVKQLFVWENPAYVNELSDLFYIANKKDDFIEIAEHWCGANGILWDQSFDSVESIGNNIIDILNKFGLNSQANMIKKRALSRLFGYVDHKDYSLNGLVECYKRIPLSEDKLINYGLKLLTISDKASSIGDNRMSCSIDREIFKTAAELGVQYTNALFELKNTPEEFYYWRECLLNTYLYRISVGEWDDDELIALYSIVNAWVNEDIESSMDRHDNKLEYLYQYNCKIIETLKNDKLKEKLISLGKCTVTPKDADTKIDDYIVKPQDNYEDIINEVISDGYGFDVEQKINATFSNLYGDQVRLLVNIGNEIDVSAHPDFITNCVIEYIIRRRKYGYRGTGLNRLIEKYHSYFTNTDWMKMFDNIVSAISPLDIDSFYNINDDIEILCLYYTISIHPDCLEELCSSKLDMHWNWLTACGLIEQYPYELKIDTSINTFRDFAKYQLGDVYLD